MSYSTFAEGVEVIYKHLRGHIVFIGDAYLTICTKRRTPDMVSDICLIVHRPDWEKIELIKSSSK